MRLHVIPESAGSIFYFVHVAPTCLAPLVRAAFFHRGAACFYLTGRTAEDMYVRERIYVSP